MDSERTIPIFELLYKEIPIKWWLNFVKTAEKRGLNVNVAPRQIYSLYMAQDKKCKLSGKLLSFTNKSSMVSIDRIDSSIRSYDIDNIQLVWGPINIMKYRFPNDTFLEYCNMVVNHGKLLDRQASASDRCKAICGVVQA